MKIKKLILIICFLCFLYIAPVKAETTLTQEIDNSLNNKNVISQTNLNYIYETIIPTKQNYKYMIWYNEEDNLLDVLFFDYNNELTIDISQNYLEVIAGLKANSKPVIECWENNSFNCVEYEIGQNTKIISKLSTGENGIYYTLYDTNYNFINDIQPIELTGFYNDTIIINKGDTFPTLKNLYEYNSWSEYEQNHLENYTTVNLDNYEYVLLSLKNYNQTDAFQTNFQVKGQIGITPIYNYGQTSKDSITGSQVQDRCNIAYSDYTSYPFYILQNDLQNNVVYAVKECSSGSSFKFDNTIFNVTYVTQSNLNDPTIVINGNTYHTIPYSDLPSTATKNEEDNYIPGESENVINGNTAGLDSAIKNVQQKMSEIWNTFSYFTDFIGQIFSSLPDELHTVLLSAFVIAILLGLIKIFIN